jgi:hypothetical protein
MTDNHIHIGQFESVYYNAEDVFNAIFSSGKVESLSFSSTSSCINDINYLAIEKEIDSALKLYGQEKTHAYFWYIPGYIKQNIKPQSVCNGILYKGVKLHPFAHDWDFENREHVKALHSLFEFAAENNFPVLIHTGESGKDNASRFESFFAEYDTIMFILAHARPLVEARSMLQKYVNVYVDTAFVSIDTIQKIISAGFSSRIIWGSDFPITHYRENLENTFSTLKTCYKKDIEAADKIISVTRELEKVTAEGLRHEAILSSPSVHRRPRGRASGIARPSRAAPLAVRADPAV